MRRQKPQWAKLASGLFVPPLLKFAPGYPCCCSDVCLKCSQFLNVVEFNVTLANVQNASCADCDINFNNTFNVRFFFSDVIETTYRCGWTTLASSCEGESFLLLWFIYSASADTTTIRVHLPGSSPFTLYFSLVLDGTLNCSDISSLDIPENISAVSDDGSCDSTIATCEVTYLV